MLFKRIVLRFAAALQQTGIRRCGRRSTKLRVENILILNPSALEQGRAPDGAKPFKVMKHHQADAAFYDDTMVTPGLPNPSGLSLWSFSYQYLAKTLYTYF